MSINASIFTYTSMQTSQAINFNKRLFSTKLKLLGQKVDGTPKNGSRSSKKRRGQTLGIELSKKRRSGDLVEIGIPEHIRRAAGNNCQSYITNLGYIVRRNASLQVDSWKKIERKDVTLMMRRVRE
ncbi:hypothetical protein Pyn_04036 [Prunus yedoensis var. nudiflora]|uniref:Uncharacterized protein n=1 Tax=Prunus yedoensis var. nudiflora TaxID=2094558 RepID=A0A314Z630_PRUYE|nr:hypothetical protein Pyn_04036 [Prunus yedoensis var. nudiflora]